MGDVGGNTLGLYGGVFGPTGDVVVAHGYQGAFHIWKRDEQSSDGRRWRPMPAPSGHFRPVQVLRGRGGEKGGVGRGEGNNLLIRTSNLINSK